MSNTIINWRFWAYHLQVVRPGDWRGYIESGQPIITWFHNGYHRRGGEGRRQRPWWPIQLYEGRRYALALAVLAGLLVWWAL